MEGISSQNIPYIFDLNEAAIVEHEIKGTMEDKIPESPKPSEENHMSVWYLNLLQKHSICTMILQWLEALVLEKDKYINPNEMDRYKKLVIYVGKKAFANNHVMQLGT